MYYTFKQAAINKMRLWALRESNGNHDINSTIMHVAISY